MVPRSHRSGLVGNPLKPGSHRPRSVGTNLVCSLTEEYHLSPCGSPQWGAADVEIKVPSVENTELQGSSFRAWSRSVYCHKCSVYCQGFLPCYFLPFRSIHLHFFQTSPDFFSPVSAVGPKNKMGQPVHRYRQLMQVPVLSARGI